MIGTAWVITLPYWLMALAAGEGLRFAAKRWNKRATTGTAVQRLSTTSAQKPCKKWHNFIEPERLTKLLSLSRRASKTGAASKCFNSEDGADSTSVTTQSGMASANPSLGTGVPTPASASTTHASRAILHQRLYWLAVILALAGVLLLGNRKFHNPIITQAEVRIEKPCAGRERLRIALASDLHLGEIVGRAELAKHVDAINALNADLILIAGDLVDGNPGILAKEDIGAELRRLKAPLGVFAVLGNHDVYSDGGFECTAYFTQNGVRVLRDEVIPLDNGAFLLAGRRDKTEGQDIRKPLSTLLLGTEKHKPLIVLDHQPANSHLQEGAKNKVDLYLSGHTHGGQVWPITWLVPFLYKVHYGKGREGAMNVHVTSGLGLWGFPARIGSNSEIVDLTLLFPKSASAVSKQK